MTEGYWVIRKYKAGPVGESIKFWMPGKKPQRMTRKVKRDVQKAMKNSTNSIRAACRTVNQNFRQGDGLLGFDYNQKSLDVLLEKIDPTLSAQEREAALFLLADHQMKLVLRYVRDDMASDGLGLRAFAATSDREWDEKINDWEPARIHHHLIVCREAKPYFEKRWKRGGVNWKRLSAQPDYTPVVTYILRQVRHVPDAKKYFTTRNLERQEPEDRIAPGGAEIRPPKGAVLLDRGEYRPGQPQYIRYVLPDAYAQEDMFTENGLVHVAQALGHRWVAVEREGLS